VPPKIREKKYFWHLLCKIRAFCYVFFSGKNVVPPKVDRAPTPMHQPSVLQQQQQQLHTCAVCISYVFLMLSYITAC